MVENYLDRDRAPTNALVLWLIATADEPVTTADLTGVIDFDRSRCSSLTSRIWKQGFVLRRQIPRETGRGRPSYEYVLAPERVGEPDPDSSRVGLAGRIVWTVATADHPLTVNEIDRRTDSTTDSIRRACTMLYRFGLLLRRRRRVKTYYSQNPYEYTIAPRDEMSSPDVADPDASPEQ